MNKPRAPLISLDDAKGQLLAAVTALNQTEQVSLMQAAGRVLAHSVTSRMDVPAFDNSAMDGYAVRSSDVVDGNVQLPVSQRVAAGQLPQALQQGTVARIFTGAPVPAGADAVIMQEQATVSANGTAVSFDAAPKMGQSIRRRGEDIAMGQVVVAAGTRLHAAHVGLLASVGCDAITVVRRPRVALCATGDELVQPGSCSPEQLPAGAIFDSNRYFLTQLLRDAGCDVTDLGGIPDSLPATQQVLSAAAQQHDLVLTSGGVSVGEEDHVKPAVQSMGDLALWAIAIKPGKPFAYGHLRRADDTRCHFIGLPGNPVSSLVTFLVLVRPFLQRLSGRSPSVDAPIEALASFDWLKPDNRREFLRASLTPEGVVGYPNQGSNVLTSVAASDVLIDNPPGQVIHKGDKVRCYPLRSWMMGD